MKTEENKKRRYFIVFYHFINKGKCNGWGNISIKSTAFINHSRVVEIVKEKNPSFIDVLMVGFNEISESDFQQWSD